MARDHTTRGPWLAGLGGALALAATVLLPFHLGGGYGTVIAIGFLAGGVLLALVSIDLAARLPRDGGGRWMRNWATLGAAGFFVAGLGLVADVAGRPAIPAEIAAIMATAAWWGAAWWFLRRRRPTGFARFSLLAAAASIAALIGQIVLDPPAGAVPARFAYVLWGPWGLWLAAVLARGVGPKGS
ncbi:MAG: hypothetical protein R3326_05675 [Gemmatimonadota bacterium]|nr:hypothetical protein [Gemmatimonadota bacterium]